MNFALPDFTEALQNSSLGLWLFSILHSLCYTFPTPGRLYIHLFGCCMYSSNSCKRRKPTLSFQVLFQCLAQGLACGIPLSESIILGHVIIPCFPPLFLYLWQFLPPSPFFWEEQEESFMEVSLSCHYSLKINDKKKLKESSFSSMS